MTNFLEGTLMSIHDRVARCALAVCCAASLLQAQAPVVDSSRPPETAEARRKITFVLVDSFSAPNVLAMIVRHPGTQESDYAAIKRSALDSKLVLQTLRSVGASVARQGEHPQRRVTMFIMSNIHLPPPRDLDRPRTEDIARRLLVAKVQQVPEFGRRRALATER